MPKKKPEQKVVGSQVLKPRRFSSTSDPYCLTGCPAGADVPLAICVPALCKVLHIDMPTAKRYWLQASLTQWEDKSGSPVWVEEAPHHKGTARCHMITTKRGKSDRGDYLQMWNVASLLSDLGIDLHKPTRIYARLQYEE